MNIWRKHKLVSDFFTWRMNSRQQLQSPPSWTGNESAKADFVIVGADLSAVDLMIIFFLLFFAFLMTACNSVAPVIKIGLVAPFEGENRAIGYDAIYAARLAVREINAAGGIGGHRVALVALDDSGDTDLAQENARSLGADPGVVAVIGHWLPETTAVTLPIYQQANLTRIPVGQPPFLARPPESLSPEFRAAYEAVTPFEETAGEYAGATYDAFQLLWQALELAEQTEGNITREGVQTALNRLE
jgi:ABC-type branched-subunit amino acid transport system substrate-binding protein